MSDITKIRDWIDTDEPEPEDGYDWPHPPVKVESLVTGDLRDRILRKLGRPADDAAEIHLIETESEGGWSEWTSETWFDLEVWIHEGRQSQKVWGVDDVSSGENALAAFMKWTGADDE